MGKVDEGGDFDAGVGVTSYDGFEGDLGLYAQVQLEAELLEIMAESFSELSPECLQVIKDRKQRYISAALSPFS